MLFVKRPKAFQFLRKFTQWVKSNPDVLAAALVGSYARGNAQQDSDVDLVLITRNPSEFFEKQGWLERFGQIEKIQIVEYGLVTSLRVWYTNDLEVEYGITDARWAAEPLDEGSRKVLSGGAEILFERSPLLSRHTTVRSARNPAP